jgi:phosphopantetheinyl transferase/lysophospholipase L1-like esterase
MQIKATTTASDAPHLLASYGQIVLFGDSITEGAWNTEWFSYGAALAHDYNRKLDVLNRGFGGYTTRQALSLLTRIFPARNKDVKLVLLFFGANDAVLPGFMQHVPLDEYIHNVEHIVHSAQLQDKVIVVTPPPIDEYTTGPERHARVTKEYAEALQAWCSKHDVPCADVWCAFMDHLGWQPGQPLPGDKANPRSQELTELFRDGLHPVSSGYRIIYETIKLSIAKHFPDLASDKLELQVPPWRPAFEPPQGTHTRYILETGWWNRDEAEQLYALATPEELAKIRSFIFPRDREMALGSLLLQKYYISRVLGRPWHGIRIERDGSNRPKCINRAVRQHDYNVSHHAESVALAALMEAGPVGIDLTQKFEDGKSLNDFKDVFTQREWAAIHGKPERFQQHWAIKEALVKAAGVGIVGNLLNIEALDVIYVSEYEPVCVSAVGSLTINEHWGPGGLWQVELHYLPRHRTAAVAYKEDKPVAAMRFTELKVDDILKEARRDDLY